MCSVFIWIFKKMNLKVDSIELVNSIKYILRFIYISFGTVFLYLVFYHLICYLNPKIYWISSILKVVLLIQLYRKYSKLLMKVRRLSPNNGSHIKVVYACFILVMFLSIALSYCKDDIVRACKNVFSIPSPIMTGYPILLKDILSKAFDLLLVAKTSLEIVIVKDAVFQMNNWNIKKTIIEYWKELINAGKIYILSQDRNEEVPILWYIRGDSCADLVDDLEKYHIKKSDKFVLHFTETEQKTIISTRKKMGLYDENDCLDSNIPAINLLDFSRFKKDYKPKGHECYFGVQLMDFSYFDGSFIKKDLIDNYRDKFILFPPSVKAILPQNSV